MTQIDPGKYLPHQQGMLLIDRIIEVAEDYALCETDVTSDNLFYDNSIDGFFHWIGVELMAQSIGIYSGYHLSYKEVVPGFLLSVRKYLSLIHI